MHPKGSSALFFGLSLILAAASGGCAATSDDDAAAGDEEVLDVAEEALSASANSGYFVVTRRDFRKCAAPMCGGFFVKRVNEEKTRCANGQLQPECYVSEITLNGTGLSDREKQEAVAKLAAGKAIVKARTYKKAWNGTVIGTLKGNEVWVGATGSPAEGTFSRVVDNGIRCITAPCPSTTVHDLNVRDAHEVIGVVLDQTATPASPDQLARATQAIASEEQGILVAGHLLLPKCPPTLDPSCGPKVIASELYFRMVAREGKACGSRGLAACSDSQFCAYAPAAICGRADAAGTCAYRPEACITLFDPVCGCNGETYSNACTAASAGVSVDHAGECAPPAQAR